jgi:hypothetical protein
MRDNRGMADPPTIPPHSEPPPEAPVTPAYGSPADEPTLHDPPPYAVGHAAPRYPPAAHYPPTAQYPTLDPPPPYGPPPRRSRTGLLTGIVIAVTVVMLLCIGGVVLAVALTRGGGGEQTAAPAAPESRESQLPQAPPSPTRAPAPTEHVVVYEVTGDGPVSITYVEDPKGGTKQLGRTDLPWRVELNMGEDSFVATLLAIRLGATKGSVACRLLVDGVEVSKRASQGRFTAVTCADLVLG